MQSVFNRTVAYLNRYMSFPNPDQPKVAALYAAMTHLFPHFDAVGYLQITAATKRAGKTRLAELMSFICSNAIRSAGGTGAVIIRILGKNEGATLIFDETEKWSSESASTTREILNTGYRRGATAMRPKGDDYVTFPTYCPKIIVGIGDVFDTLKDRTIQVVLRRGEPAERFVFPVAESEGATLRDDMHELLDTMQAKVVDWYVGNQLPFLSDRDEEIWLPLFAVCSVVAPEQMEDLKRIAVDFATLKTSDSQDHRTLLESETEVLMEEYKGKLIADVQSIFRANVKLQYLTTNDLLEALKAIPTAPWRTFRGTGLNAYNLADMLAPGLRPKQIKLSKRENKVARGYKRGDVLTAK